MSLLPFDEPPVGTATNVRLKTVEVTDRDGKSQPAQLSTCPLCHGETWFIFRITDHPHYQCSTCRTSFCQQEGCQA